METAPKSSSTDKSGKKSTASPKSGSSKRPVTLDSDSVEPENKPKRLRPKAKPAFVSKGKEKEVEEEVVAHDIFHGLPPEARDLDNIDVEGMMPMFEMTSTPVYGASRLSASPQ